MLRINKAKLQQKPLETSTMHLFYLPEEITSQRKSERRAVTSMSTRMQMKENSSLVPQEAKRWFKREQHCEDRLPLSSRTKNAFNGPITANSGCTKNRLSRYNIDFAEFQQEPAPLERISISKALRDYSMVYRNNGIQRVRVRKKVLFRGKSVHVTAQKIVLGNKERTSFEYKPSLRYVKPMKKISNCIEDRYQLMGWDFQEEQF